ncbi:MAG TPA: homocysteine S-methyltransferase family protein, partial [Chloroflexota bacterium]|nr:homocysteine S-methyltransferase family protein [Chloroflexota bacterium]
LETNTFGSTYPKLEEYDLGHLCHELNVAAARLARGVADRYARPNRPVFVAGSMGPTGFLPTSDDPVLGNTTFEQLAGFYGQQAQALVEGGADLLIIETQQDLLETKAAIVGSRRAFKSMGRSVPLQVQVTLDTSGRMLLGTDIAAVLATLEALRVDVIGLNCSTGPEHMREPVRYLCENTTRLISVIPNAGLPINVGGQAVYPLEAEPLAAALAEFVTEFGVNIVGGCCGTTPEHTRAIVARCGGRLGRARTSPAEPMVASGIRAAPLLQDPRPLIVGERVNSVGSRRVKRLLLKDDYDGVLAVAREQMDGGAHMLDVCVAMTERSDELDQMRSVVKKLTAGVETPLMIDSTEWQVVKAALEQYPGRAIVNSINLENRAERIDTMLPIVVEHGAAVVAMTIDEDGMAKSPQKKLEVARRIHDIATQDYGMSPDGLIFDVQVFPITTGQEDLMASAIDTLEGIRLVKAGLPGVLTVLGVSNLSFGIDPEARAILNSVFLYHAVQAGLDLAIVNPQHLTAYADIVDEERLLAEDLVFNRRPDALSRYIQYFADRGPQVREDEGVDPTAGMSAEERIHYQILHRKRDGIEVLIDEALTKRGPVDVLNNVLLPAMKDVGDRFGAGQLILPFVLQSAEVMKRAVAHLEQFLEKKEGYTKGTVILATVFGDVHDIGKNLVGTILSNNGYTVVDLGKQVPINRILDTAVERGATAIGLSALLVSTSRQMPLCVQELHRRGLHFPVIIGGAAINRAYGRRALFVEGETAYEPGVFYARDAFEGLDLMDRLSDADQRPKLVDQNRAEALAEIHRQRPERVVVPGGTDAVTRSSVSTSVAIPVPPFWGHRVIADVPLDEMFSHLDLKTLFRLHWGARNLDGDEWERLIRDEFMPRLERMKSDARRRGYLSPRVVYGYFPCNGSGNDLIIFDPNAPEPLSTDREITRFKFPRQQAWDRLCLADYFAPLESGRRDVVALQVVTVGEEVDRLADDLQASGDYSESYFVHGLSVQSAEAM